VFGKDYLANAFDITIVGTQDVTETIFFDKNGTPIRSKGLAKAEVRVTNVSTGESLIDRIASPFKVDFRTGIIASAGKFMNIKDGIRFKDVGRFVFDAKTGELLFQSGSPHDQGLGPREPLLCQALA
jgi:hypothetical protein